MNPIRDIYLHLKYSRILSKVYKSENILQNMSELLGFPVRKDYVNRIYSVVNPLLIKQDDKIYELTDGGLNEDMFIHKWLMDHMLVANNFIQAKNLFDLLYLRIDKIDNYHNYLFVLEPVTLKNFLTSLKILGGLIILIVLLTITYFLI